MLTAQTEGVAVPETGLWPAFSSQPASSSASTDDEDLQSTTESCHLPDIHSCGESDGSFLQKTAIVYCSRKASFQRAIKRARFT